MPPPLSLRNKLTYGLGQAAEGIKNGAFNVFLFFFYVQVLELSTTLAGMAVFIALMVDAVTDPLVGSISDNWRSRLGRRHPFLYASIIPLGFSLVGLFSPPDLTQFGLFLWLVLFAVLTRVSITLFDIPHLSLGAELSPHFHERTGIVAFRFFFGYSGQMITYFVGFTFFFADSVAYPRGGQFNLDAYLPFGITLALLIGTIIFTSARGTQNRIPFLVQPSDLPRSIGLLQTIRNSFTDLGSALRNRSFRWLFVGALIVYMMVGVDQSLNLHMNTYFWELQSGGNLLFFLAIPVGALVGAFFARRFNEKFDKRPAIIAGTLWWAGCQIVPVTLRLLGWFPENGTPELLWTLIAIKFLQGFGTVQALITYHSMIADVADEHELHTGRRQEGVFFSAVSFSNKVTSGLGAAVAGLALTAIAWPTGAAIRSAADVPADKIIWLGLLYGPIVAGFAIVSAFCYMQYSLDEARHKDIVAKLRQRRLAESGAEYRAE